MNQRDWGARLSGLGFWRRLQVRLLGRRFVDDDGAVTYCYRGEFITVGV